MSPADPSTGPLSLAERFQALLAVAESITSCRDSEELFCGLARHLQRVVRFDRVGLVLLQPERGGTSARVLETTGMGFTTLPEYPVDGDHSGWVIETQQPLIVPDTAAETRWPRAMAELREHGIVSFCSLPLTTARRRIGALGFGSREPVTYPAAEVGFLGEVAKLVAVAVDNALNFDHAQATQRQLSTERDHLRLLLEVTNAMVSNLDLPGLVDAISSSLERAIPHEFTALALYDKDSGELVVNRHVEVIPSETLEALRRYAWPGNVRELANLIERAMILSKGRTLEVPLGELKRRRSRADHEDRASTLEAVERRHILRVLRETNWTLGGPRGAAARLGMKRTTLQSLMRRLGITRPRAA